MHYLKVHHLGFYKRMIGDKYSVRVCIYIFSKYGYN